MIYQTVFRWNSRESKFRLFHIMWDYEKDGDGNDDKIVFSVALMPKFFHWSRGFYKWRLTVLGIAFHWHRSYGGRFV